MSDASSRKSLLHNLLYRRDRYRQALGILFVVLVSALGQPIREWLIVGAVLVLAGVLVRFWASGHIKKNLELAMDGPYAFVRHPLYVGNILLLCGFAVASGLWWSGILLVVLFAGFYPQAIAREDARLQRQFGDAWQNWCAKTRALLPSMTPYPGWRQGQWSFTQSLKQNGEPLIALFLLGCLVLLASRLT